MEGSALEDKTENPFRSKLLESQFLGELEEAILKYSNATKYNAYSKSNACTKQY